MKSVKTFECKIFVGLKEGYSGRVHNISDVELLLQEYCDSVRFCFTVTPTKFIYKNGNENGCIIGIINYPRFPKTEEELKDVAVYIANLLLTELNQFRISIACSDETIMLEA
jgi:hypothetical protein